MKKFLFVIGVLCIASLLPGLTEAQEVRLTSCEWRPYASEDLLNYGFTSEIISEAFKRAGYKAGFTFLPWRRAMMETERGDYDALYSAYHSEERARTYALSEPYIHSPVMFCAKKGANISYKTLRDLIPYNIGVVKGYVNSSEFDQADYLKKDGARNDLLNLRKLLKGRVDLIAIDKFVATDHLKNNSTLDGDINSVEFLEPHLAMKPVFVMFSKAVPGYQKKVNDFNKGLKAIIADGTFDNILEKHGFLK